MPQSSTSKKSAAGLWVTCLVNLFRPSVAWAVVRLLNQAGIDVIVPKHQTCCGQPSYNGGDRSNARRAARQVIRQFEGLDYMVVPSGSCAAMIRKHYPELLKEDRDWSARANNLAAKCYELTEFLNHVAGYDGTQVSSLKATYHDSCSGLRELNLKTAPRDLLGRVRGLELVEMRDAERCCGFGGAFCLKYPELSNDMVSRKIRNIMDSGAECVIAGDLGCLMTLEGKLHRLGHRIRGYHIAEILAGTEGDA